MKYLLVLIAVAGLSAAKAQQPIRTGADQVEAYLPLLKGKKVGMMINPTSIIGDQPIVDSLLKRGVKIKTIFGPEHGFRNNASNGAVVKDEIDPQTGIPVISLYGNRRKPSPAQMAAIDVMVFDLQDVGCRFYTLINTLREIMEACADAKKTLIILDRPNPNGFVDGPVLDMTLESGIGRYPIPMTHGMTMGEFAQMINGQGWMRNKKKCALKIIQLKNYRHDMDYVLPVAPSPNLNTQQSIILYPSLCMFEGTILSQGRGTDMPFTVLGAPALKGKYDFSFKPVSMPGKSETPLHQNETCYGLDLRTFDISPWRKKGQLNIGWMIELYKAYPDKSKFFDRSYSRQINSIDGLVGTREFRKQIEAGMSEAEIRRSWEPGLSRYKQMRKKYLLYP
ncbi:exo-beta-N-acetylmuramidase NamZ family protein [Chitinophaga sp. NPDC101104]|uniref:exo-beta-N-acetylmuramidase NamZ family protein n=1 Tax=Chitinophaga sp. NPDC101104 TaxID=3390561 RepID=UPI003D01F2C2